MARADGVAREGPLQRGMVRGAHCFRNPDEDLPQDFNVRHAEYYAVLEQLREGRVFVEDLGRKMEVALSAFDANLLTNTKVKIVTTRKGKRPYLPDAAGGATSPAQHFGFDRRISTALANDELAGHPQRDRIAGPLHRTVPHPFGLLMKNQAQPQVTLAGAEGGSGLLELDIPLPEARWIAFGAVGALKVDAVIHRSPGSFAPANVQA